MRTKYLTIGDHADPASFTKGAYFVGKMAWPKGLGELFSLMDYVKQRSVDIEIENCPRGWNHTS